MTDRSAALRRAVRSVVAERGLHGASMASIARAAGVATGTAYVYYESKHDLVIAAYLDVKAELGAAASEAIEPSAGPAERFRQLWVAAYRYFAAEPDRARFLVQFESGPFAAEGHTKSMAVPDDPLMAEAQRPDVAALLVDVPVSVLYDLALGPAARAVAGGHSLDDEGVTALADACWRAITR